MSVSERREYWGPYLIVALVLLIAAGLCYPWVRAHQARQAKQALADCRSRQERIGTCLELYSADNDGRYPIVLQQISPIKYMGSLPTCPNHPIDYKYVSASNPDAYTITCEGPNHVDAGMPPDCPSFNSTSAGPER